MATELATGYISLIPTSKGIVGGLEKELGGPAAAAGASGGAAASTGFKKSFTKGIASVAVPVAIVAGIVDVGLKFNDAFNTIARGTGATGKTLDGLDQSFKNVLKSGSGSFDQVSAAVTTLYQRTGLTGKALDDFAGKQVTLARITKTDVATNLQSTTGLFNLYGVAVGNQSDELDTLFRASQVGGVSITQLASDMQTAAPVAKTLGLSLDKTAALTAGLEKAGLPAGKVMLGLASSFAKAAKAGQDPVSVIHDLVAEVKKAPSATAAATIAEQKFGIGARQAATLVAGLRSGAINLNATLAGGKGINETAAATTTLTGKLLHLRNEALVGLEPLATDALGAVTRGVQDLVPVVTLLTDHMNILGPALIAGATAFAAFKVAVGVKTLIGAATTGLAKLKDALITTVGADEAATTSSGEVAGAQQTETVTSGELAASLSTLADAALAAAGALGTLAPAAAEDTAGLLAESAAADAAATSLTAAAEANGAAASAGGTLALTTAGFVSVVAVGVVAAAALGKTLYDLFAVSTKQSVDVRSATDQFAVSLLGSAKNAVSAAAGINNLADATKVWFKAQGAADEQTGGAIIRNLGLSYHDVAAAVTNSNESIDKFVAKQHLSVLNAGILSHGLHDLRDALQEQAREQIVAFQTSKTLSAQQVMSAENAHRAKDGTVDYVATLRDLGVTTATVTAAEGATNAQLVIQQRSWTNLTTAILGNTDALRGSQEGVLGILGASVSAEQGLATVAGAQKDYNDAVKKFGANSAQAHAALLTLQADQISQTQSVLGAVDATEKWAAEQSGLTDALKNQAAVLKKSGPDSTAYAKATDLVTAAQGRFTADLKGAAAETKGPVHDALVGYINDTANLHKTIDGVPSTKTVTYTTPGLTSAQTRTHDFRGELDGLKSKSVTISLDASVALHTLGLLDQAVRAINPTVSLVAVNRAEGGRNSEVPLPGHAAGGFIPPGTWGVTGEEGWELAYGGRTGLSIMSHSRSQSALSADLADSGNTSGPRAVFTGPIQAWDDRDLARRLDDRMRRAEMLAAI